MMENQPPTTPTPFRLPNGQLIDAVTGEVIKPHQETIPAAQSVYDGTIPSGYVEVPTHTDAQNIILKTRTSISDLGVDEDSLNVFGLLLVFELLGLNPRETSKMLSMSERKIELLRNKDEYQKLRKQAEQNLRTSSEDAVRDIIASKATTAANKVASLMNSDDERISLSASRDILDRAGHRPVDTVEHRMYQEDKLVIEVVERVEDTNDSKSLPVIDITPIGEDDGNS